jgi:hypothetical protein
MSTNPSTQDDNELADDYELADGSSIDLSQPVVAYKLARIVSTDDDTLSFAGAGRDVSYDAEATATCLGKMHRAPSQNCGCGFWAIYRLSDLHRVAKNATGVHRYDTYARLTVELTGPAELHELGLRARTQRVLSAALPATCARCKAPSTKAVLTKGLSREVLAVCAEHVREKEKVYSAADLANALGTEVSFTRALSDESTSARYTRRPHSPFYNNFMSPYGLILVPATLVSLAFVMISTLFMLSAINGSYFEDLSPMLTQAADHPGQIVSYDGRAVQLNPIHAHGTVVGATSFDMTSNRCAVVVKAGAPKSIFAALAPMTHSYQTSYVATSTAFPDTNYVNENTTNSSPSLRAIRANHSSYIVAQTTAATPTQCTAIATTLTGT